MDPLNDTNLFKAGERGAQRVVFFMDTLKDGDASLKEGRPIYKEVPFIKIFTAGDNLHVHIAPVWDEPSNPASHTGRFPEEWKRFQAGLQGDEQSSGTPLKLMPGISASQVRELEHFHVKTVEQLAEMPDAHVSKFMGAHALKQKAREFILVAKGEAPLKQMKAELQQRDDEIAVMKAQIDALLAAAAGKRPSADVGTEGEDGAEEPPKPAKVKAGKKKAA